MRFTRILATLFLVAAGLSLLPARVSASDNVQRRSKMILTEPTEIPGTVLQPGTYLVKVLDYRDEKEIVQFTSEDDKTVFATVLAIRDRRVRPDDGQTGFIYFQRLEGNPIALKSWYVAGDDWGEVFAYPKAKAVVIAQATHEEVVATPDESTPTLKADVEVVKPDVAPTPDVKRDVAPAPHAEPAAVVAKKASAQLPKTGSTLPLFGLLGLGALAGGAALHLMRRMA
jgi:LPXTG-motif cell wall-anchored protein